MISDHDQDCSCEICQGMEFEKYKAWESEMLQKHGWITHYVCDDNYEKVNCHTHGLPENFGHLDLQIVVPLSRDTVNNVFACAVDLIKKGIEFRPREKYDGILKGYSVTFTEAIEASRHRVLRMILPDQNGAPDIEEMDLRWAAQWERLIS